LSALEAESEAPHRHYALKTNAKM